MIASVVIFCSRNSQVWTTEKVFGFLAATVTVASSRSQHHASWDSTSDIVKQWKEMHGCLMMSELSFETSPPLFCFRGCFNHLCPPKNIVRNRWASLIQKRRLQVYKTKYMKFFGSVGSCAQMGWIDIFPERTNQKSSPIYLQAVVSSRPSPWFEFGMKVTLVFLFLS